ncbi:hypothetical protein DV735_g4248, partial [Chaetothyriales sp. CBS 134920]
MVAKRSRRAFEADWQRDEAPFVLYGTPLPPLDDGVRDDGSFVPVWKQEVTDDRGRKRLHGAFTGGFSAGYFNTVGSKEGWAPSSFVSSRSQRAKDGRQQRQQRPEDFMDEDDLREAQESRQLSTADAFSSGFGTQDDERLRATLNDIFRPSGSDTAGVRLLKRMGWKEGQGIGPKVKRKADLDDGGGDADAHSDRSDNEVHAFAPDDVSILSFAQKKDRKGLGFEGESTLSSLTRPPRRSALNGSDAEDEDKAGPKRPGIGIPKLPKKRGGIGVGILNDTGSDDDDDPYSMGPKISYNKTIGGDRKAKKTATSSSSSVSLANPALKTKPVLVSKKLANLQGVLRKCHDGRLPLDGFILGGGDNDSDDNLDGMASLSLNKDKYKPPAVPTGWQSSFSTAEPTTTEPPSTYMSVSEAARSSRLDAQSRASVLGEASLPGKSVFDFLTPAARDRLAAASGKPDLPPGLGERPGARQAAGATTDLVQSAQIPNLLSPSTALDALRRAANDGGGGGGWMPYSDEPAKQERYKVFLQAAASGGGQGQQEQQQQPALAPHRRYDDEWVMEQQEFTRAAQVFRPVSGAMASRFTSAAATLTQSSAADNAAGVTADKTDPATEAARVGMFGHLTRTCLSFHPTRLLCKRFGVPMPNPAADPGSDV